MILLTVTSLENYCLSSISNLISKNFQESNIYFILIFDRDIVAAKLDNFSKLEPTLRNLKIKFDSRMIDDIIKGKRGVSLRLLYQIKMALEKVYPPTDIAVLKKSNISKLLINYSW